MGFDFSYQFVEMTMLSVFSMGNVYSNSRFTILASFTSKYFHQQSFGGRNSFHLILGLNITSPFHIARRLICTKKCSKCLRTVHHIQVLLIFFRFLGGGVLTSVADRRLDIIPNIQVTIRIPLKRRQIIKYR